MVFSEEKNLPPNLKGFEAKTKQKLYFLNPHLSDFGSEGQPWTEGGGEGPSPRTSLDQCQDGTSPVDSYRQLSQVTHFWRQGRSAVFHLKSLNNGQAELSLTFQLPHPSEIIPPSIPLLHHPIPNLHSQTPWRCYTPSRMPHCLSVSPR